MQVRLLPVEQMFNRFPRMVRDLARKAGKETVDPLTHLLRNSVDHGIETREQRAAAGRPSAGRRYGRRHDEHTEPVDRRHQSRR